MSPAVLALSIQADRDSALPSQGSMFFLDCERGPFAVTAGHVFDAFVEHRGKYRVRGCQIGNAEFNPEERLIALGTDLGIDIATFHVTREEIARTDKKIVRGIDGAWPPRPNKDEAVFFGGLPGCERDQIGRQEIVFGLHSAMPRLTSFTDHQLCCQFDRSGWVDVRGLGLPQVGMTSVAYQVVQCSSQSSITTTVHGDGG